MSSTRREFSTQVKVISEEKGIIQYVASSAALDSHREIVDPRGWRFNRMKTNPVFVNSHNYWSIEDQLGKVLSWGVREEMLIQDVQWAIDVPECRLARFGFNMTVKGYLNAVSVGFIPVRYALPGTDEFAKACAELRLPTDTIAKVRCIYLEQEQIELSACLIGSNPDALARAFHDGAVKEEELAGIGFGGDREMRFLLDAGDKWSALDPEARFRAASALESITQRHFKISGSNKPKANSPCTPDGGDAAQRQADEELMEISKRLEAMAKRHSA